VQVHADQVALLGDLVCTQNRPDVLHVGPSVMHCPPAVPLTQQTPSLGDSVPSLENGHKIVMGATLARPLR
jgi:hypothetical protein